MTQDLTDATAAGPTPPGTAAVAPPLVAVDLSLTATGLATWDGVELRTNRVTSRGHRDDTYTDRANRLLTLHRAILDRTAPGDLVVIEGPSYGSNDTSFFDRSGLWWLLVSALHTRGHRVAVVAPASVKKYATGKGNAAKDQVLAAVIRRYPAVEIPDNNVADAVALAAMALDHYGQPLAEVPAKHREAITAVSWPLMEVAA